MNPVNRSAESPRSSDNQPSEVSSPPNQPENTSTEQVESSSQSDVAASTDVELNPHRLHPIPPPSNPKQYRAIGLVQGLYQRSEEQMTKGVLVTLDGTVIDAVLLGRLISLVKNHLDLEQPHLWVVYPRTRQENDSLHVQIVGVWEPENLNKDLPLSTDSIPVSENQNGYFSVRGELIYFSQEKETAIVKIRQAPKRELEKPKFFKLQLKGTLPDRAVGHFWDFQVQLQGDALVIQEGTDLGILLKKKVPFRKGNSSSDRDIKRRSPSDSRPIIRNRGTEESKALPIPKPVIKPIPRQKINQEETER
jgi:hypothetical protein